MSNTETSTRIETRVLFHDLAARDFKMAEVAERWLEKMGFSVGHAQRGDPRGILFGSFDIQKWRNLNAEERRALHGNMTGDMRRGPIKVTFFASMPEEAWTAFEQCARAKATP